MASSAAFEARVVADYGRNHLIEDDRGTLLLADRRGKRGDVVVGDRVRCVVTSPGQAVIDAIVPRTSLLYRADAFRTKELAANVSLIAIVFAPRPSFNERFIWRALAAAQAAEIRALLVLNKIDLDDEHRGRDALARLGDLGYPSAAISAKTAPDDARQRMRRHFAGEITLLIGQSGMGKSTLINLLVADANARTQEFSQRLDVGKQTTTHSRWFPFENGALIDSPGFQSFGLAHLDAPALAATFPEFAPLLGKCRFLDCQHLREPQCAIRAGVQSGQIDPDRYAFYQELAQARQ